MSEPLQNGQACGSPLSPRVTPLPGSATCAQSRRQPRTLPAAMDPSGSLRQPCPGCGWWSSPDSIAVLLLSPLQAGQELECPGRSPLSAAGSVASAPIAQFGFGSAPVHPPSASERRLAGVTQPRVTLKRMQSVTSALW